MSFTEGKEIIPYKPQSELKTEISQNIISEN